MTVSALQTHATEGRASNVTRTTAVEKKERTSSAATSTACVKPLAAGCTTTIPFPAYSREAGHPKRTVWMLHFGSVLFNEELRAWATGDLDGSQHTVTILLSELHLKTLC
ncbi:hypothetical protein DPMN_126905 [Dreissena polymorpha]|uniref:Uncharacterized protein n=1 Tax=Dreissena polymorpha TaxID=45954 RepID=A0A9D4H095_DREPO|nr:hypothetical protein DPMN_126905 [Dreissena polymorpha]